MTITDADPEAVFAAIQEWLSSEGHEQLPPSIEVGAENGSYTLHLDREFDPDVFAEMVGEEEHLQVEWIDREEGVIGALIEEEIGHGIVNRAAYGTTFHRGHEVLLSGSGPPMTESGEPIDDSVGETLVLLSKYLRYS